MEDTLEIWIENDEVGFVVVRSGEEGIEILQTEGGRRRDNY